MARDSEGFGYIYIPSLKVVKILWEFPPNNWFKSNIDGALKGNTRPSSYVICIRGEKGDLLYAECSRIEDTTSIQEEIIALLHESKHFNKENYSQEIFQMISLVIYKIMQKEWVFP